MTVREVIRHVERRMVQPDWTQLLTLFFVVVLFVLGTRWAGSGVPVDDSWYGVAPTRWVALALLALGYGAAFSERPRVHRVAAITNLAVAALVSYPIELAAYAVSHPAVPLWWGLVVPLLAAPAFFGLGVALGRVSARLRLRSLLPLTVPGLLVGLTWLDIQLGAGVANPLTTATTVAPGHLAVVTVGALVTIGLLLRPEDAPTDVEAA